MFSVVDDIEVAACTSLELKCCISADPEAGPTLSIEKFQCRKQTIEHLGQTIPPPTFRSLKIQLLPSGVKVTQQITVEELGNGSTA